MPLPARNWLWIRFHVRTDLLRSSERRTPLYGLFKASTDSLPDHATFELGEGAGYLKHQLSGGRRGVNRLDDA